MLASVMPAFGGAALVRSKRTRIASALLVTAMTAVGVAAQCGTQWLAGEGVPGVDGLVTSLTVWDEDGAGPLPQRLVLAGDFRLAGGALATRIAAYEPVSGAWASLGGGVDGQVSALTTTPNGDLIAGGYFRTAGSVAASAVARWNGRAWAGLGPGLNGGVKAATALPNGDVIVGGWFTAAGSVPAYGVARWDGAAWWGMAGGMNGPVEALVTLPNGDVIAGGRFSGAAGVGASYIARWDGTAWSPLGSGMNAPVVALAALPGGDVLAGGDFTLAGGTGASRVARWNGSSWTPLGAGANDLVNALLRLGNGDIIAAGSFTQMGSTAARHLSRWDGAEWTAVGVGPVNRFERAWLFALATLPDGSLVVGGSFQSMDNVAATSLARWDGAAWSALATGLDARISALVALADTRVVAGGEFRMAGGVRAGAVASWDGRAWSPLGTGMDLPVQALCVLANGDVVAGGWFRTAGGVAANCIARWNGTAWSPVGSGMAHGSSQAGVVVLATLANGDVVAGGRFDTAGGVRVGNIARWDGVAWSALGAGFTYGGTSDGVTVHALEVLANGDLVAGGWFTAAGGAAASNLARWDGQRWWPMGGGVDNTVRALAALPNGDLVVGGSFFNAGGTPTGSLARFDGRSWFRLGYGVSGDVFALHVLPDGDVVAGGPFGMATNVIANGIARWNGTAWSAFGFGMGTLPRRGGVLALASAPSGDLLVGGEFLTAGGLVSARFARLTTTCPAAVTSRASGCSLASPVLRADALPWVGGTFRATCSGMGSTAVGVGVFGRAMPAVSLRSLHPAGAAGCLLLAGLEIVVPALPVAGIARVRMAIPDSAALIGLVMRHQVLQIEADPSHALARLSSSDGLTLTLGSF